MGRFEPSFAKSKWSQYQSNDLGQPEVGIPMRLTIVLGLIGVFLLVGCSSHPTQLTAPPTSDNQIQFSQPASNTPPQNLSWGAKRSRIRTDVVLMLPPNDTPQSAMARLIQSYEAKKDVEYTAMFTGDYKYEFSNSTDPVLVTMYSGGWFKSDEGESALHLFNGYTPPGGATLNP